MSGRAGSNRPAPPCVIGRGCAFQGLLSFQGEALVAGQLRGEVFAQGTLWVAETAQVRARIEVDDLVVAGALEGEIRAGQRVELRETARVRGPIRTPRLAVADGARFEGRLEMGPSTGSAHSAPGASPSA